MLAPGRTSLDPEPARAGSGSPVGQTPLGSDNCSLLAGSSLTGFESSRLGAVTADMRLPLRPALGTLKTCRIRSGRRRRSPCASSSTHAAKKFQALLDKYAATNSKPFGSVARGTARQDSDIDILVEMDPADGNLLMRASGLMEETRTLFDRDEIDVFPVQLLKQPISQSALKDAIAL